jgi:opacity protein-like surface antigen
MNSKEANMRKALTAAIAAITLGGAVCAAAAPAEAQHWRGGYGHGYYGGHYRHDNGGAAVAAGVVGLALGAALASNHNYYHGGYYAPAYAYDYPAYRTCETTRWVWDPYVGHRVPVREAYPC